MACGRPRSARAISGRDTGLTPGPESMPSVGVNHGRKLRSAAGDCKCLQEVEEAPASACGSGELKWGGRAAGERRDRGELSACGSKAGGAAQTKCRACTGEGGVKENEKRGVGGGGGGGGGGWASF